MQPHRHAPLAPTFIDKLSLNRTPKGWSIQREYGAEFPRVTSLLTDQHLTEMMDGRYWLGSCARRDDNGETVTDRLAFDVDCKDAAALESRDICYHALRRAIGLDVQPLVYQTPSGLGLRVVYRIPEQSLAPLISGVGTGLIADTLRSIGLDVQDGRLELFPQQNKPDRVMLGPQMRLLNPETLKPILPRSKHAQDCWRCEVELSIPLVDAWYSQVDHTLVQRLQCRASRSLKIAPSRCAPTQQTSRSRDIVGVDKESIDAWIDPITSSVSVPAHVCRLVDHGLTQCATRYHAEFAVARAFVASPGKWPTYALSEFSTEEQYASAVAQWLSNMHNNRSGEWQRTTRTHSVEQAIERWTARYLAQDSEGRTMIDRARSALSAMRQNSVPVLHSVHFDWLHTLSAGLLPLRRYRFEIWAASFMEQVFLMRVPIVATDKKRGGLLQVSFGISAQRLRSLRYGSGEVQSRNNGVASSQSAYRHYLQRLLNAGVLTITRDYVSPTLERKDGTRPERGEVRQYRLAIPAPPIWIACTRNVDSTDGVDPNTDVAHQHATWARMHAMEYDRYSAQRIVALASDALWSAEARHVAPPESSGMRIAQSQTAAPDVPTRAVHTLKKVVDREPRPMSGAPTDAQEMRSSRSNSLPSMMFKDLSVS